MNLLKPQHESKQPWHESQSLQRTLNDLQTRFSNIIRIPNFLMSKPFASLSSSIFNHLYKKKQALSTEEIKKRMVGIPIYTLSDNEQTRCGVASGPDRNTEFYFFSKADAENYMQYLNCTSDMQILDIPLANIVDYEGEKPSIRLVPELSQVNNAVEERKKDSTARLADDIFSGVTVFQSDYLEIKCSIMRENYRPGFLRKEDLEKALVIVKGSEDIDKERDAIQVATLEDVIQEMKDSSTSKWNDILFVAPGTDMVLNVDNSPYS